MRFLLDESADMRIGRALRLAGHDVRSIVEEFPSDTDEQVAHRSREESRILITEDRDFGRLLHATGLTVSGIIFVRYTRTTRSRAPTEVVALASREGERLHSVFVVMQPGRERIRDLPAN